jgi:hypothetical protein
VIGFNEAGSIEVWSSIKTFFPPVSLSVHALCFHGLIEQIKMLFIGRMVHLIGIAVFTAD